MKDTITPIQTIARIGIAVVIAVGFTSCQKECISNDETSGKLISEIFSATIEQPATKTATADGGATVTWAASDKVHYYTADAGTVRNFTITAAGASATLDLERETGDTYYNLVYAGSTTPAFTTNTSSSMVFDGVKATQDGTFANANVSVARTAPGGSSVTFKPVTAIVKFTTARTDIKTIILSGGTDTEKVAGNISVNPTAASPVAALDGDGSTSIDATIASPAAGTYYINILPGTYSNGLKMTLKNAAGNIIGHVFALKSIDLSTGGKIINLGNIDSHIVVTANCYIVSAAGTYKFKTVKGNSATLVENIASVAVLWESFGTSTAPSVGDLVNNVSYADNYITFTATSAKGNALVVAKDGSGNILWSWHIWLTDTPENQVYNNLAGTMMDRNLGATSATKGDVKALGLIYQWGRKDPFLGGNSLTGVIRAASTLEWPSSEPASSHLSDNNTLAYSISHPTTYITNSNTPYDWYCTSPEYRDEKRWRNDSAPYKTIYDPCPPGYRVPDGNDTGVWAKAFGKSSYRDSGPWDGTNKGMDFGSGNGASIDMQFGSASVIWYPAAGYRDCDGGGPYDLGALGGYWSCMPHSTDARYAYCLTFIESFGRFGPSDISTSANARSVRCISE